MLVAASNLLAVACAFALRRIRLAEAELEHAHGDDALLEPLDLLLGGTRHLDQDPPPSLLLDTVLKDALRVDAFLEDADHFRRDSRSVVFGLDADLVEELCAASEIEA